jgi:hypothetical protein
MNKKIIFSTLLVTSVLITACTNQANPSSDNNGARPESNRTQTTVQKDEAGVYSNKQFKFSLIVPSQWNVKELDAAPSNTTTKYFSVLNIIDTTQQGRKVGSITAYARQENQSPSDIDIALNKELVNVYREPLYRSTDKKITLPSKIAANFRENEFCKPVTCDKYIVTMKDYILEINQVKGDPATPNKQQIESDTKLFKKLIDSLQEI